MRIPMYSRAQCHAPSLFLLSLSGGTSLDHGVLAVGYGTSGAEQYWLVKNSWGTSWGAAGFVWLGRGAKYGAAGQCGIFLSPSYPTKN
jgi:C1A family cysteine protease